MNFDFNKCLGGIVMVGSVAALTSCSKKAELQNERPNIVFILADDLGWGDVSCYGQTHFSTPNIDNLANNGIRFTRFYSGTTVSAPSRCCLLTGLHSGHAVIRGNTEVGEEGQLAIPSGTENLFKDLKAAGYITGAFGKWGLGQVGSEGDPNMQGIDRFFGYNCQRMAHSYYPDHLWDNQEKILLEGNTDEVPYGEGTYSADLIHEKALEFIEECVSEGKPFCMWYPTTIPHAELIVPRDSIYTSFVGKFPETPYSGHDLGSSDFRIGGYCSQEYPHAVFASMVSRLDMYVGQIVSKLKELGVYDNTVIIFSSDNGPHLEGGADPDFFDSNGPWRGYKRDLYEGGIRVPFIVEWNGVVRGKQETDFMCSFWDILPTLNEIAGIDTGYECDGISFLPLLKGKVRQQQEHEALYFEFPSKNGRRAITDGKWKMVHLNIRKANSHYELYDLEKDPSEENNLFGMFPDVEQRLISAMDKYHVRNDRFPLFNEEKE